MDSVVSGSTTQQSVEDSQLITQEWVHVDNFTHCNESTDSTQSSDSSEPSEPTIHKCIDGVQDERTEMESNHKLNENLVYQHEFGMFLSHFFHFPFLCLLLRVNMALFVRPQTQNQIQIKTETQ